MKMRFGWSILFALLCGLHNCCAMRSPIKTVRGLVKSLSYSDLTKDIQFPEEDSRAAIFFDIFATLNNCIFENNMGGALDLNCFKALIAKIEIHRFLHDAALLKLALMVKVASCYGKEIPQEFINHIKEVFGNQFDRLENYSSDRIADLVLLRFKQKIFHSTLSIFMNIMLLIDVMLFAGYQNPLLLDTCVAHIDERFACMVDYEKSKVRAYIKLVRDNIYSYAPYRKELGYGYDQYVHIILVWGDLEKKYVGMTRGPSPRAKKSLSLNNFFS